MQIFTLCLFVTCASVIHNCAGANITVLENETAVIPCSVSGTDFFTWRISNEDGPVLVQHDVTKNAYVFNRSLTEGQASLDPVSGSLTLSSVSLSDEHKYYCDRGESSDAVTTDLIVNVIPDHVTLQPEPPSDYIAVGSILSTQCQLDRVKPPATRLSWLLQGKEIDAELDLHVIRNKDGSYKQYRNLRLILKPDHHGKDLICRAFIGDKITSKAVILQVGYGPSVDDLTINPANFTSKIGDEVSMTCNATGLLLGKPDEHWYAWNKIDSAFIVHNSTDPTFTFFAQHGNEGTYACSIGNAFGQTEESEISFLQLSGLDGPNRLSPGAISGIVIVVFLVVAVAIAAGAILIYKRYGGKERFGEFARRLSRRFSRRFSRRKSRERCYQQENQVTPQ